ncbi:MAG: sugar kinase [Actinobacteria bacterium]|nr:sugar kinase [Actinomycetota bacterium]
MTRSAILEIRSEDECQIDALALGEVMLRFDPREGRIRTARSFAVSEGGGEYNVARGLRKCFGLRAAIVTGIGRNDVGRLLEDLVLQGGVDLSHAVWKPTRGIGWQNRNALNFTERGFGVRGALGVSDRANTATAALEPGDVDWDHIFGTLGVRWFHTGGIFAGLSETTAIVAAEAMNIARQYGTIVSYDLNYRPSIWEGQGGRDRAQIVNRELVEQVDVLIGNEEDFTAALGFSVPSIDETLTGLDPRHFEAMNRSVVEEYQSVKIIATTLREVHDASTNDWGAVAWSQETGSVKATHRTGLHILDRVGGGDSFASGLIFALLNGRSLQEAVELGAAHGALAMTTPGDTSMASVDEVEALAAGGNARVVR